MGTTRVAVIQTVAHANTGVMGGVPSGVVPLGNKQCRKCKRSCCETALKFSSPVNGCSAAPAVKGPIYQAQRQSGD